MTKIQQILAENIKSYRNKIGYTQEKLAEKIGTSTNYLGTIETGKKYPSANMIEKIAAALNVNSPDLFKEDSDSVDLNSIKASLEEKIQQALNDVLK